MNGVGLRLKAQRAVRDLIFKREFARHANCSPLELEHVSTAVRLLRTQIPVEFRLLAALVDVEHCARISDAILSLYSGAWVWLGIESLCPQVTNFQFDSFEQKRGANYAERRKHCQGDTRECNALGSRLDVLQQTRVTIVYKDVSPGALALVAKVVISD